MGTCLIFHFIPDVGTSCFGEVVILSSKAIKGVAKGGPELVASLLKSRIWSNSGWASIGGCFRLTGTGSRSNKELSFFLKWNKFNFFFLIYAILNHRLCKFPNINFNAKNMCQKVLESCLIHGNFSNIIGVIHCEEVLIDWKVWKTRCISWFTIFTSK